GARVSALGWNRRAFRFTPLPGADLAAAPHRRVVNVVPGDFDLDGRLDLLLMQEGGGGWIPGPTEELELTLHLGNGTGGFNKTSVGLPPSTLSQPFVVDFYGNMEPNLLGHTKADAESFSLWRVFPDASRTVSAVTLKDPASGVVGCKLSDPHSSGFADFDGDCRADILLVCHDADSRSTHVQIWTGGPGSPVTATGPYRLAQRLELLEGAGQVTLADMDSDGTIDIVYPTCTLDGECYIATAYNVQMPLCKTSAGGHQQQPCRPIDNLCTADENFLFETSLSVPVSELLGNSDTAGASAAETLKRDSQGAPLPIRVGDFNNDGYPDLMLLTTGGPGGGSNVRVLQSVPCTKTSCGSSDLFKGRRAFRLLTAGVEDIDERNGYAVRAAFFDLNDDGTLDILVGYDKDGEQWNAVYMNSFYNDAFSLKAL
ncbi:hypothetical protein HK405_014721, partial [Cladochytrium tenue]